MKLKRIIIILGGILCIHSQLTLGVTHKEYNIQRLNGLNRYETSLNIVQKFNSNKMSNIILASGNSFPDALGGSLLSKKLDAPILLVDKTIEGSKEAISYINEHLSKEGTIYILGGIGVISDDFKSVFNLLGYNNIKRLGGADRYETNNLIMNMVKFDTGTPIVIANGNSFTDALSISSIAASKGYPLFLSDKKSLPEKSKKDIISLKPDKIYLIGSNEDLDNELYNELLSCLNLKDTDIVRLCGEDKYDLCLNICKYFNLDTDTALIASGIDFPDALSGSSLAAKLNAPIILTDGKDMMRQKRYLDDTKCSNIILLGGYGAISEASEKLLNDYIYYIEDMEAEIKTGDNYTLPEKVEAQLVDGSKEIVPIKWLVSYVNTTEEGTYLFQGNVEGYSKEIILKIKVVKPVLLGTGNTPGNIVNKGYAAFKDGYIYFRNYSQEGFELCRMKEDGTEKTIVCKDKYVSYINVIGEWIYYQNNSDGGKIYKVKTDGTKRTKINDDYSFYINVIGDWIYYFNQNDKGKLYKIKTDGTERSKLNENWSHYLNVSDDCIYYKNDSKGGSLYKVRTNGKDEVKILEDKAAYINVIENTIYFKNDSDKGRLYKTNIEGTEKNKLCDDCVSYINVCGNSILYKNESDGGKLYLIQTDGKSRTKLSEDKVSYINVASSYIYYINEIDNKMYRIQMDGKGKQLIY